MPKFYGLQEDELKGYMEIRVHNEEEFNSLMRWINFRKRYPFWSWLLQMLGSLAVQAGRLT